MATRKRLATLVGINYINTPHELHGCINDVLAMQKVLVSRFGFQPNNITLLTDLPDSPAQPTGANIRLTLQKMIATAEPHDLLFFHFSGHGTRIPGHPASHKEEAIVPSDFNLITDLDFRQLVNKVPAGATFTIISDSCHSGGLIDQEKEQIGPDVKARSGTTTEVPKHHHHHYRKARFIPYNDVVQHLTTISCLDSPDVSHHLWAIFSTEASPHFWPEMALKSARPTVRQDAGILLSGCQADETSADASPPDGNQSNAFGAFSNALQTVLKQTEDRTISNSELVLKARELLGKEGYEQHPCLYCSDQNVKVPFLLQPGAHHKP